MNLAARPQPDGAMGATKVLQRGFTTGLLREWSRCVHVVRRVVSRCVSHRRIILHLSLASASVRPCCRTVARSMRVATSGAVTSSASSVRIGMHPRLLVRVRMGMPALANPLTAERQW